MTWTYNFEQSKTNYRNDVKPSEIAALEPTATFFKTVLTWKSSKLTDLGDRNHRSNIIVHGILQNTNENETSLRAAGVTDMFEK